MGNSCSVCDNVQVNREFKNTSKNLVVASLNYGGILKSPFEFYSDQQNEQKKLSMSFCRLLPIYIKQYEQTKFEWDIGKIDHKLQSQRYTPLYNQEVGIDKVSNKLITANKFNELWDEYYKKGTSKTKVEPEPTKEQKVNAKLFDLICYHSIIDYVYNQKSQKKLEDIGKQLKGFDVALYKKFMEKKFSKSFLNEDKKIKTVIQAIHEVDVMFLQEPTKLFIDKISSEGKFFVKSNGEQASMIVIRKQKFSQDGKILQNKTPHQYEKQNYFDFNGNKNTVALVIDKFIFLSVHLSSKPAINPAQVQAMKKALNKIRKQYQNLQVILGSDANSYVTHSDLVEDYQIYPNEQTIITTSKKRSYLQPQFKKADKAVQECKDHIITTLKIKKSSVQSIDFRDAQSDDMLPTDIHPFDHFMVKCSVTK